jgi:hypothetical protein
MESQRQWLYYRVVTTAEGDNERNAPLCLPSPVWGPHVPREYTRARTFRRSSLARAVGGYLNTKATWSSYPSLPGSGTASRQYVHMNSRSVNSSALLATCGR